MKLEDVSRRYLWACTCTLGLTGLLKLISAFGHAGILEVADPLFGIQTRSVLSTIGIIEIFIAITLRRLQNKRSALCLASWTWINFLLYRSFLIFTGTGATCPCLGTWVDWLGVRASVVNDTLMVISISMSLGGILLLFGIWKRPVVHLAGTSNFSGSHNEGNQ